VLALCALVAFLLPVFGPSPTTAAATSASRLPIVICTADGLAVLDGGDEGSGEPTGEGHALSCLACVLRLGSPPPEPLAGLSLPHAGVAHRLALPAAAEPQASPHLRPDKTGPPARA
jgi:hypothetical protein